MNIYKQLKAFEKHRIDAVYDLLPKGGTMLDLACGEGRLAIKALSKFKEVFGVDISPEKINKAIKTTKDANIKNAEFKVCDLNKGIKSNDGSFDTVTAVAALAFFVDPIFIISEIHRVLKRRGTLVMEIPNTAYLPRRISLLLGRFPNSAAYGDSWDGGHLHYFTKDSIVKLLEGGGFQINKVTGSGIFSEARNWWPSLLCGNIIIYAKKNEKN